MPISGLQQRHTLCKICCAFDDETLSQITLDILMHRKTYVEIKEYYNKLLPEKVLPLNDVNINSHRKHSDPVLVAENTLRVNNQPVTEGDMLQVLYAERYKETIDKKKVLMEIYRQRIKNLEDLSKTRARKEIEFLQLSQAPINDILSKKEKARIEKEIRSLTKDIDEIQDSLQQVIIRELNSEKGIGEGAIHITQNFVNLFQGHLKGFMNEIIPYLLIEEFPDDQAKAERIIKMLSKAMDRHLTPAFEESKLLGPRKEAVGSGQVVSND